MNFRSAEAFTRSLSRLNGYEQKTVKATTFDLQKSQATHARNHQLAMGVCIGPGHVPEVAIEGRLLVRQDSVIQFVRKDCVE